ncbi:MAG: tRNA guanosine(34) transglycosylase Tgt [Candidatus Sericytochromatia bacterium]|nr:tRNA guanosine(34) transglycosylase Tgt [Candidatus Sericytochromatia bacterium]
MTEPAVRMTVLASVGAARAGILHTPHGDIPTPTFMPVGTQATVKALLPDQVASTGAGIVLANAFHCMLRPGSDRVARAGGLHAFMRWSGAVLTDSGGFQVFSLAALRSITEEGVHFRSPVDGSRWFMDPERSMRVQMELGADIAMVFDECIRLPATPREVRSAVDRTTRWAERCLAVHDRPDQALFGIVQGGIDPEERRRSAEALVPMDFPGYAVGGLSVGESREDMARTLGATTPLLPESKPRYLMGVGTPEDLRLAISHGIDMADCVHPTRMARHGTVWSGEGRFHLKAARFADDERPIDPECDCLTCARFDRRYLHHLVRSGELLAHTLLSLHNLRHLQRRVEHWRAEILAGTFQPNLMPVERVAAGGAG